MTVAISQSNYIPWKGYFDLIAKADVFVIYDEVQYTKNDWRNRNQIMTKAGKKWLTIAVRQQKLEQTIQETEVADRRWAKKHWKTLQAEYAKAPYFDLYKDRLAAAYEACAEHTLLTHINEALMTEVMDILQVDTQMIRSNELQLQGDRNERLLTAVQKCGGTTYLSGPAAQSYLDVERFKVLGIDVEWMDYSGYKPYAQAGGRCDHHVSVLDLLFHTGPDARSHMKYGLTAT